MTTIETLRQFRIGPYAIFDLAVSFLGVAILAPLLSKLFLKIHLHIPFWSWMLFTLPLGFVVHLLANQNTQMTKDLLDPHGHYFIKVLVLACVIGGMMGISRVAPKA